MSEQPVNRPEQTLSDSQLTPPAALPPVTLSTPPSSDAPQTRYEAGDGKAALPVRERLGRFEVHSEIGRGGMGAVLRGRDPALGRDLAIKVLLAARQGNADAVRRFHEEAQIGGQLQHPGLVPVYEMGADGEGRPFFAMKLVDGQTLAALLKDRQTPADSLPRFLTIFEQVCQALAYAHARGVIHRDLKPANIMVGAFGEVQVMDWGLAKVLSFSRETPASAGPALTGVSRLNDTAEASRDGSVMGTPAYMPPEQARGEIDRLDQRADVFGLGAILCEILTGQPAFAGENVSTILSRAASGDLTESYARLDGCGADAELVTLARSCLAADVKDRPADAGAVATRIGGYRAGVQERLRKAELERAAADVKATEERKRRRLALALAAALILLLILVGGGYAWLRQQRIEREADHQRQEAELVHQTENDLNRAALARQTKKWDEAWKAVERAEERLGSSGREELRARVRQARRELEQVRMDQQMVAKLEEARLQKAAASSHGPDLDGSRKLWAEAFTWYGVTLDESTTENIVDMIERSAIREELLVGLDDWSVLALPADAKRLQTIANGADGNEWRKRFRGADLQKNNGLVRQLASEASVSELRPTSIILLADALRRAKEPERALALLREGRQRYPADFWLNFALAHAANAASPPQDEEAVRYYTAAQALRPDSTMVLSNLASILRTQGKLPDALAVCREAIRLKPDWAVPYVNLGLIYSEQHKLPEAATAYREAIRLKFRISLVYYGLGNALKAQHELPEAIDAYREAIRLNPVYAEAYCNLGWALRKADKLEESLAAFRRGHEIASRSTVWPYPSDRWLRDAVRLVELERRLPNVLNGKDKPANAEEQIGFAQLCDVKHRRSSALRLYQDAFKADAGLTDEEVANYRYDAACFAALAALAPDDAGKPLDAADRVRFRQQALEWIRESLAAWTKRLDSSKAGKRALVEKKMRHWQQDGDFVSVRDALADLPETERAAWQKLWQDVEALLKRAAP